MTNFEINITRTCRSCLNESGNMCVIQESIRVASAAGFGNSDEMTIADLIMSCTKIRIMHNDGFPQLICSECLFQVQQAYNYKQMCEASDAKLREFLHKNETSMETELVASGMHDVTYDSIFVTDFNGVDDPLNHEDFDSGPAADFSDSHVDTDFQSAFSELDTKQILPLTTVDSVPVSQEDDDEDFRMVRQAKKVNGRFQCEKCPKTLADRKTYLLHVRLHLQKNLKRCLTCGRGFAKQNHLNRHMATHSKSFACHHCLKVFDTKQERKEHVADQHSFGKVKLPPIQSMVTRSKSEKNDDQIKIEQMPNELLLQGDESLKTDLGGFSSSGSDCGDDSDEDYKFEDQDGDADDIEDSDNADQTPEEQKKKKTKRTPFNEEELRLLSDAKEIEGKHQCPLCFKILSDRKILKFHIRSHVGVNLKHCSICQRGFAKGSSLNRHILSHERAAAAAELKKSLNMSTNDSIASENDMSDGVEDGTDNGTNKGTPKSSNKSKFTRMYYDEEELRLYNDAKEIDGRFQCPLCFKWLSTNKILKLHIRAHVGKNLKHCSICQRGFAKGSNLNRHILSHKGENDAEEDQIVKTASLSDGRYNCPFCVKSLVDKQTFRLHIRLHIGNRLKRCEICDRGFNKQNHLDKHMKVHGVDFNCDKCDKVFKSYKERRDHQVAEHKIKMEDVKIAAKMAAPDNDEDDDNEDERLVNSSKLVNGRYLCPFCEKTLANRSSLKFHIRLHIGKHLHKCSICEQGFSKKSHLGRHMLTHLNKMYTCKHCDVVFNSHQERRAHILKLHKDMVSSEAPSKLSAVFAWSKPNGTKQCVCMICDTTFDKIHSIKKHLLWHSNTPDSFQGVDFAAKKEIFDDFFTSSGIEYTNEYLSTILQEKFKTNAVDIAKLYRITNENGWELSLSDSESECDDDAMDQKQIYNCAKCQQSFDRLYKLMCHMRDDHSSDSTDFAQFKCSHCSQCYPSADVLAKHLRQQCENAVKTLTCSSCENRFMWQNSLDLHTATYHSNDSKALGTPNQLNPKPFACDLCPKSFYRQQQLDSHRVNHLPRGKRFSCEICKKNFTRTDNLRTHMRVHIPAEERENINKHLCSYCGRSFSNSSNLVVHIRRHTGEKPYKCDFCSSSFPRSSDLHCHRRTHTGEKPCLCTICGKGFSRSNKLVRHMRIHTGDRPYKCPHCERAFTQSNDLTLHIRRHTGDKPYVCSCGERFITNSLLQQHRRTFAHFDESSQEHLPSNSVNNPNRLFAQNDGKRLTTTITTTVTATKPTTTTNASTPMTIAVATAKSDVKPLISLAISPSGVITTQTPIETYADSTSGQYVMSQIKNSTSFDFMM